MALTPLSGSRIQITEEIGATQLAWQETTSRLTKFGYIALSVCWIAGGFIPAVLVVVMLHQINAPQPAPILFAGLWGFVFVYGGLVAWFVYRLIGPQAPESIKLTAREFIYDSGQRRPKIWPSTSSELIFSNPFASLFRKRQRITISHLDFTGFILERIGERQRLRFDHGIQRVEIGRALGEVEREWLHQYLQSWHETL